MFTKLPTVFTELILLLILVEGINFSFNQYLIKDDEPLLFHTGLRKMFPLVKEAVASVLPVEKIRYVAFTCGSR